MMRPTLEILADRGPQAFRQLAELVADGMHVGDKDRATTIDGQAAYVNRVGRSPIWYRQGLSVDRNAESPR